MEGISMEGTKKDISKSVKKTKKKPIFYLLKDNELTKIDSSSSSISSNKSLKKKLNKQPNNKNNTKKMKKRRLKTPIDFIIMPSIHPITPTTPKKYNEEFINIMEQLSSIMLKQGEVFKARAYQKAQETIMTFPEDIISVEQLKGLPGIGSTIMEKLNEYVRTGTLTILEREKNNPVNILGEIYGIGPKKSKELVKMGITNIEQLKEEQDTILNDVQKVGLKYHEDILKKIPRVEIDQYKDIFQEAFQKINILDSESKFEIVGSYRRGAQHSGDIDVIITSTTNKIYNEFIELLLKEGVIIEVLSRGASKCLVITKLEEFPARRVDFLYTSPKEYPFAILYFTGSKIFNTVMRQKALKMGYTLNEHGIYKMTDKKKGDIIEQEFPDEKSIFDFLDMEYKEPWERKDGRSVNNKNPINILVEKETGIKETGIKEQEKQKIKNKKTKTLKTKNIIQEANTKIIPSPNETIKNIVESFKKMGIKVLEELSETQLESVIKVANTEYYNDQPLLTDNEYDIIKEFLEDKFPHSKILTEVGAPVTKNKVKLPYEMASMNKIKPDTEALNNWKQLYQGPYVISCKLDGVSALFTTEGETDKLYTRGNGIIGQDISYLIPYLHLPKKKNITIRGELLIRKQDFEKHLKSKFANPRNLVSGIVNQKKIDENIKYLHFVAYETIHPELTPSEQMEFLESIHVEHVMYKMESHLTNEMLSELLVTWRKDYTYEIDGIIVTDDHLYPRKSGNPEHAFAFKMVLSDQMAEAKVIDVIWNASKDGYLKPRVRIEPIHLGGVTIEYATGFNGAFIENNKIGIGALIEIIRSGDVIPHIKSVTQPALTAKMPTIPYIWNENHVDILLEDIQTDPTVKEKNITGFFHGIGVDGLSSGNIKRIIDAGYTSISDIVHMTESDFLKVDGFKQKLANKIYNGIQDKVKNASIIQLMTFSNIFGRGLSEKKIEAIMNDIPNILTNNDSDSEKIKEVSKVKGMATKSAENFVNRIEIFKEFLKDIDMENLLTNSSSNSNSNVQNILHPLYKKNIVMTGARDKELIEELKTIGANITTTVNKNTFVLITGNKEETSSKMEEANKLKITILTPEEFKKQYFSKK